MKIVQMIARLNVGGSASQVVWLTKSLQNEEFQSVLIAGTVPAGEEDMSYFALEQGVTPVYISELSRELSLKDLVALIKIFLELRRQRPSIVHTHTAKAGTIGRIAALAYKWLTWKTLIGKPRVVKVVHTFHGHVFHSYYSPLKTRVFITIERMLARFATNRILVITQQQFDEIHGEFNIGTIDQFETVTYGIDLSEFAYKKDRRNILRGEINASDDCLVIGFFGRLTEIKNVPLLLETAALYNDSGDDKKPGIKFAIVGEGHLRADLERRSEDLGLRDVVHFLGNRKNVAELLAGTDVVAISSNNEGTPLSLIEAMAAEKAVISTAVGGVVDLLGPVQRSFEGFSICKRGISVESGSQSRFLAGLMCLAEDEELRATIERNGLSFVKARYSLERLEKEMMSLYRNLSRTDA